MQSTGADQHRSWSGGDQETFAWGGEPSTKADVGDELWVPVPPGWIELAAHPDDASADEWFADLLDATPGLGHEDAASLAATFAHVRAALSPTPVDAAGVLLTVLDDHPTLWQFSLTLVAGPPSGTSTRWPWWRGSSAPRPDGPPPAGRPGRVVRHT